MSADRILKSFLEDAQEGASLNPMRKGNLPKKLIGRTTPVHLEPSKPLFMNRGPGHPSYKNFTEGEHRQAAVIHRRALRQLAGKTDAPSVQAREHHSKMADFHVRNAAPNHPHTWGH